jgi:DNA (cytosine-5)-methyltransferase 1
MLERSVPLRTILFPRCWHPPFLFSIQIQPKETSMAKDESKGRGIGSNPKIPEFYSPVQVANILGVSKHVIDTKAISGKLAPKGTDAGGNPAFYRSQLEGFKEARQMFASRWDEEATIQPVRPFKLVELFAGAGGLAIGMEMAGLESVLLNEIDKRACATLRANRAGWNLVEGDVAKVGFREFDGSADVLTGGFPCQAFSYAGQRMGFKDARGTLFFEYARAVTECNPRVILAENVRGLLTHDKGRTFEAIKSVFDEIGYQLVEPRVLKAIFYKVPQKRERLFFVAVRKDLARFAKFKWPSPYYRILDLRDAFCKGDLYPTAVPPSPGNEYSKRKKEIMSHVPAGGYWRDLPYDLQREYMMKSYFQGGGKTGMARRLAWDEPSLTLTCSPAQKQTVRRPVPSQLGNTPGYKPSRTTGNSRDPWSPSTSRSGMPCQSTSPMQWGVLWYGF